MVNIIGYKEVVVGEEVIEEPIYDKPIIVIGSGDKQEIWGLDEYEAKIAEDEASIVNMVDKPSNL